MTIIQYMVPEIRSVTNRIFCHFGPCFALLPHNNQKHKHNEKTKKQKKKEEKNTWRYVGAPPKKTAIII